MRDDAKLVTGNPPNDYDYRKFADILNRIETFSTAISSTGPIRISELYTTNLATSGTGLKDGQVWNNGGLLVVNPFDAAAARTALGVPADADLTSVVEGPASATDGDIAVFDGTTGKLIKDGYSPSYFQRSLLDVGSVELGSNLTGDRNSYIDFHSDDTNTDFSARILRGSGVNGALSISNYGTGAFTYNSNTIWHSGNFTPSSKLDATAQAVDSAKLGGVVAASYAREDAVNNFLGGQVFVGAVGNKSISTYTGYAELQAQGSAGGAAIMSFHRPGSFAAYFGIDTDNKWKIGGWSMGAVAYEIWHAGNLSVSIPNVGSTVAQRDSSGDIQARLFRSEYTATSATIASIMTQQVVGGVGTNNYIRPSTPAQVAVAVFSAAQYVSPLQSIVNAGSGTLAHGLGQRPNFVNVKLYCAVAEGGYAVGDYLEYAFTRPDGGNANAFGVAITSDATNLYYRYGSSGNTFLR